MSEWQWDLGADGVVRLVSDDRGVETVYLGARVAARSTTGIDEHRVWLKPRGGIGDSNGAYRREDVPAREVVLRRTPRGWLATRDGVSLPPIEVVDVAPPAAAEGTSWLRRALWIAFAVIAVLGTVAMIGGSSFRSGAREREALLAAPHETTLTTRLSNENGGVTVMAPADFKVLESGETALRIVQKDLGEAFDVVVLADPKSSDLDAILRSVADTMRQNLAKEATAKDMTLTVADPVAGTCNGEMGRVLASTFHSSTGRVFRFRCCASSRPGIGLGDHLPPIQMFNYLVPEPLAARDAPLLESMIGSTTIGEEALRLAVPPPPPPATTPATVTLSPMLTQPPHTSTPSYATSIVRVPASPAGL